MNMFWNQRLEQSQDTSAGGEDQLSMIPTWSVVLAIIVFGAVQYLFHGVLPHRRTELLPMRLLMGYSWGTAFASYVLLVGYVSRDVRRRRMPGGIGAVVYFLLRQPMMAPCPHCSTELAAGVHFCPQCQFQLAPVCGRCFRGVQITDVYCTQCGHDLAEDHTPARLRVYSD
jgi:hypothetical protein